MDKSLVQTSAEGNEHRYEMLETVKEYAREKLRERGIEESSRRQHLAWAIELAERVREVLYSPNQEIVLAQLDAELDNMRVAFDFARTTSALSESHLRLGVALWPFWQLRGLLSEGREQLALALQHAGNAPDH